MKLIEYMPTFLRNIREFIKIFDAEDKEVEQLNQEVKKMTSETIVKEASNYGLERYEKIYNIKNKLVGLEARRTAILLKMNNRTRYTYKWLVDTLNEAIGNENYKITIDYNSYKIHIEIALDHIETMEILKRDLINQIPANMEISYMLFSDMNIATECLVRHKNYDTYYANFD